MIANRHWWSTTLIIRHNNDNYTHTISSIQSSFLQNGSCSLIKYIFVCEFISDCVCVCSLLHNSSLIVVLYYWLLWKLMDNHTQPIFCYVKKYKKTAIIYQMFPLFLRRKHYIFYSFRTSKVIQRFSNQKIFYNNLLHKTVLIQCLRFCKRIFIIF